MIVNTLEDNLFFIETFPVGPLQCNCSVIADKTSKKAMIVDPGGDADKILRLIAHHELSVVAIIRHVIVLYKCLDLSEYSLTFLNQTLSCLVKVM
mgnify:CR=1 FL=1